MRTRYERYERPDYEPIRGMFRGHTPQGVWFDEMQNFDGEAPREAQLGTGRVRLPVPPARMDPDTAGKDLLDAVTDLEDQLNALRDAGLSAVSEPLAVGVEDIRAVSAYIAEDLLPGWRRLYETADRLLLEGVRAAEEFRRVSEENDKRHEVIVANEAKVAAALQEQKIAKRLVDVLFEAEARRTIKKGTTKRWVRMAHERAGS